MASRSLEDLAQPVKKAALGLAGDCQARGIELLIYCTLRSVIEQADLYASGRSTPGKILTNAKPGESMHNPDANGKSWAFDAVPTMQGVPQWRDAKTMAVIGVLAEARGLEWAGRWTGKLRESVHFQILRGKL